MNPIAGRGSWPVARDIVRARSDPGDIAAARHRASAAWRPAKVTADPPAQAGWTKAAPEPLWTKQKTERGAEFAPFSDSKLAEAGRSMSWNSWPARSTWESDAAVAPGFRHTRAQPQPRERPVQTVGSRPFFRAKPARVVRSSPVTSSWRVRG